MMEVRKATRLIGEVHKTWTPLRNATYMNINDCGEMNLHITKNQRVIDNLRERKFGLSPTTFTHMSAFTHYCIAMENTLLQRIHLGRRMPQGICTIIH